jgi:menaquinone-dependent protoporphyrinogen oxidase
MTTPRKRRVLVTYGSKREGTREIATAIAAVLREQGMEVDCLRAHFDVDVERYDAVVIGGALYMGRWHRDARRFVTHHTAALRSRPVWMFSSGPLDFSASDGVISPTLAVKHLMRLAGARGHATFGGRLARDARGFPASAMARTMAGDYRDWNAIDAWAKDVVTHLQQEPLVEHRAVREPARWPLAALCLLVGFSALYGGANLMLSPDGAALQMPLSYLQDTPFASYFIPGLILALVIGVGHLATASLALQRSPLANLGGLAAGVGLLGWIAIEMLLLGTANVLQVGMLFVGAAILGETLRRLTYARAVLH